MLFQNKKKKKRYTVILAGALVALFLTFFLFGEFPPSFLKRGVLFLAQPLISAQNRVLLFVEQKRTMFKEKEMLENENIFLKQKIVELEIKETFSSLLEEENRILKEALSFDEKKSLILSSVIMRPGFGVYNSLFVDAGSRDGVKKGMPVTVSGNVLLGYVFEVMGKFSNIKLVSFPGEEINVFVGNKITAIAVGLGGENLEITLPRDIEIEIGTVVTTLGSSPMLLGVVEEVIKDPINPFQRILFRLPVNIYEIRHVFLVREEQ